MMIVWARARYRRHTTLMKTGGAFVTVWAGVQMAAVAAVTTLGALTGLSGMFLTNDEEIEEG
jgi:hypothetical protein